MTKGYYYLALVVEESLKDKTILEKMKILKTIEEDKFHIHYILVTWEDRERLINELIVSKEDLWNIRFINVEEDEIIFNNGDSFYIAEADGLEKANELMKSLNVKKEIVSSYNDSFVREFVAEYLPVEYFTCFVVGKVQGTKDKFAGSTRGGGEGAKIWFPGGHSGPNETGREAIIREAEEEGWEIVGLEEEPFYVFEKKFSDVGLEGFCKHAYYGCKEMIKKRDYKEKDRGLENVGATLDVYFTHGFDNRESKDLVEAFAEKYGISLSDEGEVPFTYEDVNNYAYLNEFQENTYTEEEIRSLSSFEEMVVSEMKSSFDKANQKAAMFSMYKSLKMYRLKKGPRGYGVGMRPVDKKNVSMVFPLAESKDEIADGVKTIFGVSYQTKVFQWWMPKRMRIKEMIWRKRYITSLKLSRSNIGYFLPKLMIKKSILTTKGVGQNLILDYTDFYNNIFPAEIFGKDPFNQSKYFSFADKLIVDYFKLLFLDNKLDSDTISVAQFETYNGGGASKVKSKMVIGIDLNDFKDKQLVKFINPAMGTLRFHKKKFKQYAILMLLRAYTSGMMKYTGNPFLKELWEILKGKTIVFYNDAGFSFMINTEEDPYLKRTYMGSKFLMRMRTLLNIMIDINNNRVPEKEEEEEIDGYIDLVDKEIDTKIELIDKSYKAKEIIKVDMINNKVDDFIVPDMAEDKIEEKKELEKELDSVQKQILIDKADPKKSAPKHVKIKVITKVDDEDEEVEKEPVTSSDNDDLVDNTPEEPVTNNDETELTIDDIDLEDPALVEKKRKKKEKDPNLLTAAQQKRLEMIRSRWKEIEVDGKKFSEIVEAPSDTKIYKTDPKVNTIVKEMNNSTLVDFEKSYVDNLYEKDIFSVMNSFSKDMSINFHLQNVTKEDTTNNLTEKYTYAFEYEDDNFKKTTIKIDVPKIDKDGFMKINGNRKVLKKQLFFLPVVKTKPSRVMITSNMNKFILERYGQVLNRDLSTLLRLIPKLLNNPQFKHYLGNNEKDNKNYVTNMDYDALAKRYYRFSILNDKQKTAIEFYFNQNYLRKKIQELVWTKNYVFSDDRLPIGLDYRTGKVIEVEFTGDNSKNASTIIIEYLQKYLQNYDIDTILSKIAMTKRRMFSRLTFQSYEISLISLLGATYGLKKTIAAAGIKTYFQPLDVKEKPDNIDLKNMVSIRFKDGTLYYSDMDSAGSLLLNGLNYMNSEDYTLEEMDTEMPYIEYTYRLSNSRNLLKGMLDAKELFLDPITREILVDLGLPTDFLQLMIYANSLLEDNKFTGENDLKNYRIRGYEMIPALLYRTMQKNYRSYKRRSVGSKSKFTLQQEQIFIELNNAFICENYDMSSPINEIKNKSAITFKGPMGLNDDRSYTKEKRMADKSFIGNIAISSVEGGSCGINKTLTLNPDILSTRGYFKTIDDREEALKKSLAQVASPAEVYNSFVNLHDEPKRIGFAEGQTKHVIKVHQSNPLVVTQGLDKNIPYLVGDNYVPKADKDGFVEKIDHENKVIVIRNDDGTVNCYDFEKVLSKNSSYYFNNTYELNVKEGQKVKARDILAYEKEFFKKDILGNIRESHTALCKYAIHERMVTDDDSSCITERMAKKLSTDVVKRKQIVLVPSANLISYSKVGDHLLKGDAICTFEDARGDEDVNEMMKIFGDISEDVLKLARQTPKAPETGEIIEMKVYYTRPLEEYSDSLYDFMMDYFAYIKGKIKVIQEAGGDYRELEARLNITEPNMTGRTARINGSIIPEEGGILIEYYINHDTQLGVGDKITFNANIKSIDARVIPIGEEPTTEDGIVLDGVVGSFSIAARMAVSPYMTGIMTHCLVERSREIAKEYLGL